MGLRVGDTINIDGVIRLAGVLTDPTTLTLVVTDPTSVATTYTWPTPSVPPIVRDSVGTFHLPLTVTLPGHWVYQWSSTGTVIAVQNGAFDVEPLLEQMTITVTDMATPTPNPLPGVAVQIYSNPMAVVAGGFTDSLGGVVFELLPGSYEVDCTLSRTVFADPFSLTVSNTGGLTPQTATFAGNPLGITTTAKPNTVKLFGHLIGYDGRPVDDVRVVVETLGFGDFKPFVAPGSGSDTGLTPAPLMVRPERRELRTDFTGYWEADVVADSTVRVAIADVHFDRLFRVPNDPRFPTLNIADVRPDPGPGAEVGITTDTPSRDALKGVG